METVPGSAGDSVLVTHVASVCLVILVGCMAPCLYRIWRGGTLLDRLLAFDLTGVLVSLALAVYGVLRGTGVYLEISMGLAVLALVATIAVAHYIERKSVF